MISVCIASYNGEHYIEKQLASIRDQSLKADEVIICDDRSTDGTADTVRAFIEQNGLSDTWKFYENEQNLGYCMNFYGAIEKAHGDVIFLSDQDDVWLPDKIITMVKYMTEHPETAVLASRYDVIDGQDNKISGEGIRYLSERNDNTTEDVSVNSLIGCSYIRGFSLCFSSKIKRFLKPIDVKSLLAHDWFICMIGALTGKTTILNRVLSHYRFHESNVSLSAINRQNLLGDRQVRVDGLAESIEAHTYMVSGEVGIIKQKTARRITRFIRFEKRRLKFLKTKNPFLWLILFFGLPSYKRYYKSYKGALRIWIGDFLYGYNINFKK